MSERLSMAIFIAKGKNYVVPSCDIRNCTDTVLARPTNEKMPNSCRGVCLGVIESFWLLRAAISRLNLEGCSRATQDVQRWSRR
jgi:hypothetical protein